MKKSKEFEIRKLLRRAKQPEGRRTASTFHSCERGARRRRSEEEEERGGVDEPSAWAERRACALLASVQDQLARRVRAR